MAFAGFGFGATTQPTTTPSLFGTTAPTSQPSLFGSTPAPSLFGQPTPATPAPSLFGQAPAAASTTPSTFSFGAPAATAPPPSTGLFGAPAAPLASTGLFGGAVGGGVGGGGLFGGGGLGASAPKLGGLFGAPGGSSLLGQQQQQPLAPQAPAAGPSISKRTKFNELPDAHRNTVESIDNFIRSQIQISEELKGSDLGSDITKTTELYEQYSIEGTTVLNMLSQDSRQVTELRHKLEKDQADLAKITAIVEGFKNPQAKGAAAKAVANFPFEYFSGKAEEFRERLSRYKSTMDQIQHQLSSSHSFSQNPAAILPTLRAQHTSFMSLASHVASLDSDLKVLKDEYRSIYRAKTGSVQDPFAGKGRRDMESGLSGMTLG